MRTNIILLSLLFCVLGKATAQNETIDISGNNTSSSYVTYNKYISIPAGKTTDVRMARYCYFSSTIAGKGTLNLYAGGERAYLGTEKERHGPTGTPSLATSTSIHTQKTLPEPAFMA